MRDVTKAERLKEIHAVAYALVAERGYGATSMLTIAKEARASNETMYRWFGDKKGLFKSMVEANADETREALADALAGDGDPLVVLREVGPVLLSMLLGERAIVLNRAAAADTSGDLGEAIASAGRDTIQPLITGLMERAIASGQMDAPSPVNAAEWFIALLVGDRQIRRVIGRMREPTTAEVMEHVAVCMAAFEKLAGFCR